MHDLIRFLKDVVTRTPGADIAGCYVVREGSIYARNMTLMAGVAMESEIEFSVPAEELDLALARMKEVQSLTVEENTVTIKAGRLKSTIKLNPDEPSSLPEMPEEWLKCPAALIPSISAARPFIGDRSWSLGIRLAQDRVTAFSNLAGIDIEVPGLLMGTPALITETTAAFLVAQGAPSEYAPEENAILFRWPDGRWACTQLLTKRMPDIEPIFAKAGTETSIIITAAMREAYADAAALSDGTVMITPNGFRALKGASTSDVEAPMALPEGHISYWSVKTLDAIMACATAWHPAAYPNASLFIGPGLRGVVAGVRR